MTVKEIAKKVVDSLPDDATMDDVIHALCVQAKSQHGETEVREGKPVPHEQGKERTAPPPFDAEAFHRAVMDCTLSDEAAEAIEKCIEERRHPRNLV